MDKNDLTADISKSADTTAGTNDKIYWHPAFCGATEWELKKDKDKLIFDIEFQLSKKPLQMDMLVIKKDPAYPVENEIGRIFKTYNILEFKGSGDGLSIDDYYKVIGYAALFKSLGKHVNEIPAEEITLTIIREAYPRELFKALKDKGVKVDKRYEGIYYLSGKTTFKTQVIVTRELDGDKHASLKILSKDAQESDVRRFLEEARLVSEPGDLQNVDAVLQVSVSANAKLYEKVREDESMCQALRELMKDVIDKEIAEERADERRKTTIEVTEKVTKNVTAQTTVEVTANTKLDAIKKMMKNLKLTAIQAMQALEIPESEQSNFSALL